MLAACPDGQSLPADLDVVATGVDTVLITQE